MQENYQLIHQGLGAIPIANHFLNTSDITTILEEALGSKHAAAILLLTKNILLNRHALYAIHEWSSWFDPSIVQGGNISDDAIARALDKLFETDRSSLLTRIVLSAIKTYDVDASEIHQDTTSVSVSGAYITQQSKKAIQLKHGYSKDHRPDLKQLVYALSVTRDGAVPIHFKAHDGNRTDDTLHTETWQTLRGILGRSDFLYVADSKLCVSKTLLDIDRSQGKFVTMLPRTRREMGEFTDKLLISDVRWEKILVKKTRKSKKRDVYETASGLYQMSEGFRLHWFRSSEKKRRDYEAREEKIASALDRLRTLNDPLLKRAPRTEKAAKKRVEKVLDELLVRAWIHVEVTLKKVEQFKQKRPGPATPDTDYRKTVYWVPQIHCRRNPEGIAQSEVLDGVFPLATNTDLEAVEVLKSYKYQPTLERRHTLFKSVLQAAPVFLKKNDRIEALMFVYFIAQLIAALIERQLRLAMTNSGRNSIEVLPEGRPSKHPTVEQIFRLFEHQARRLLYSGGKQIQIFAESLTKIQGEILDFLKIPKKIYS